MELFLTIFIKDTNKMPVPAVRASFIAFVHEVNAEKGMFVYLSAFGAFDSTSNKFAEPLFPKCHVGKETAPENRALPTLAK